MTPRQGGGEKAWKLPAPVHGKSSPPSTAALSFRERGWGPGCHTPKGGWRRRRPQRHQRETGGRGNCRVTGCLQRLLPEQEGWKQKPDGGVDSRAHGWPQVGAGQGSVLHVWPLTQRWEWLVTHPRSDESGNLEGAFSNFYSNPTVTC